MAAPALAQNAAPYRDCTALPPNLVDNCGFEQAPVGDEIVPGWGVTFGDGSEPALTLGPTTELPHSGSGVLVFQPAGGNDPDTVTQSLPHLQPSSTYQFGVWWYGGVVTPESIPDSSGTFDAYVDGVVGGTQYAVKKTSEDTYAPGWSFSMVNFTTAASGTPRIVLSASGASTYVRVDDVAVAQVPSAPVAPTNVSATAGDASATVSFHAPANTGGLPITAYTVTSSPGGLTSVGCTSSPCTVSGLTNGTPYTFTVTASNLAGTSPASSASSSVTPAAEQSITFAQPETQTYGTPFTAVATSDSDLPVTFSSTTDAVCTVTLSGVTTFHANGTCTIDADQAGNDAFLPATTVERSFQVDPGTPGAPTITSVTTASGSVTVSFTPPTETGGSPIVGYLVSAGQRSQECDASPCTVSGLVNGSAYEVSVAAQNELNTGPAAQYEGTVTPLATQTIEFANPGSLPFTMTANLMARATSDLPVTFTTLTPDVCTVTRAGGLTPVSAGDCTIAAHQDGDDATAPAPEVDQTFSITAVASDAVRLSEGWSGDTTVSIAFAPPVNTGGAPILSYSVTARGGTAPVTISCAGSPCTITGLVNGTAYTVAVVPVTSAGNGASVFYRGRLTPHGSQTISVVGAPESGYTGTSVTLAATATSGLPVTAELGDAGDPGACSVSGLTISLLTPGTCVVGLIQAGDAAYSHAVPVVVSIVVTTASASALTVPSGPVTTGSDQTFTASGLLPGTDATFVLHSNPIVLGTVTVSSTGVATLTTALPSGVTGSHTVIVTGTSADGTAVTLSQGITIADPAATLSRTGAPDLSGLLVLAGAALLGGAVLLLMTRRRRAH